MRAIGSGPARATGQAALRKAWGLLLALSPLAALAAEPLPAWSNFFPDQPQPAVAPEPTGPRTLPGSARRYTQAEIDDLKNPPDWFPEQHPPLPAAVARGGASPFSLACAACHLTSGMGHPESSSLAGLTSAYMMAQIADFQSGARRNQVMVGARPQANGVQYMVNIARALSPQDAKAASDYFAALKPLPWVKVVERAAVPRSYINAGYMRVALPGGGTEPIGRRIIELPQSHERQTMRDPNSGTVAYAPPGSVARGKALVRAGACRSCHGADLKGVADVPHLAGRSPTYTFRQLWFFKDGSRAGANAPLMKAAVERFSEADMIAVAAYLATLPP